MEEKGTALKDWNYMYSRPSVVCNRAEVIVKKPLLYRFCFLLVTNSRSEANCGGQPTSDERSPSPNLFH